MKKLATISSLLIMVFMCVQCGINTEQGSHIDILKQSEPYCKDRRKFNIHTVNNPKRAAEIRNFFQLDTLYADTDSTWDKTLAIEILCPFICINRQ